MAALNGSIHVGSIRRVLFFVVFAACAGVWGSPRPREVWPEEQAKQTVGLQLRRITLKHVPRSPREHTTLIKKLHESHLHLLRLHEEASMGVKNTKSKVKPILLRNHHATQYAGHMGIGSPKQEFPMIYDTGSGVTWVPATDCTSGGCPEHNEYNYLESSTASHDTNVVDAEFKIVYGSGAVRGGFGQDDLHVGGFTLPQAKFGVVRSETGNAFKGARFAGIVGLAFPSLSKGGLTPVFDQFMEKKVLKHNKFGFYLQEKRDGAIWLDTVPKDTYEGELVEHRLMMPPAYWSLKLIDIKVNGKSMNVCPAGCKVAIDSGTSLLTGPSQGVGKVLKALDVKTDCANFDQLPELVYVLEGQDGKGGTRHVEYPLKPSDYVLESGGRTACHPGLSNLDVPKPNGPIWILGDMFMMRYMTIFDRDKKAVFMAKANPKAVEKKSEMALTEISSEVKRAQKQGEGIPGGEWTRLASSFEGDEDAWEERAGGAGGQN